jgi:hypothetical protein
LGEFDLGGQVKRALESGREPTPIERFTVVLAAHASLEETRNLRLFFEEWERILEEKARG